MVLADCFSGLFGGFQRSGFAAFPNFRGRTSSPLSCAPGRIGHESLSILFRFAHKIQSVRGHRYFSTEKFYDPVSHRRAPTLRKLHAFASSAGSPSTFRIFPARQNKIADSFWASHLFWCVSLRLRSNLFYQKFVIESNLARSENVVVWNVIVRSTTNSVTAQHPLQNTLKGVFLRFCRSVPPSPRHHAFCFDLARSHFLFFGMVVAGEAGFLQRRNWRNSSANSVDSILPNYFLGIWIWQNRD